MTPAKHKTDRPIAALLVPDILALLEETPGDLAAETEEMHPADLANVVEALPPDRVGDFLRALSPNRAAQVIEYLDEELRAEFLEHVTTEQAAEIISEMTPDDRADVLEALEEETADEILSDLPEQAREETEKLLQYEPDTAGGLMTTGLVSVQQSLSIEEALSKVRLAARSGSRDAMHAIYVVDDDGRLVGVMSLRELVAAPDGTSVADIMNSEIVSVPATADREEVARITSEYDRSRCR
jgi:magnesium transporter